MQNLLKDLEKLLKKDERLVTNNKLLKNKIMELALKVDRDLIKILLSDNKMKSHFFIEIDNIMVFNKDKFIKFIENKQFLPDSYTAFKNKIGLISVNRYFYENNDVVLAWPYKDCILEGGQTKEELKRNEIFWNEILAPDEIDRLLDPKVLTNFKLYDKTGEHELKENVDFDNDNLIINGNNLLGLTSIIKRYREKIKLIYIDPPFNTDRDTFKYNDSFKHSTWLTFIKNRLYLAYHLLSNDGNIFIHVDNNESHYLKILLDEIFGRENFINEIIWYKGREGGSSRSHSQSSSMPTEYQNIFIYAKKKNIRFWNPPLGPYKKSTINRIEKDSNGWFYKRGRMGRTPAEWELKAGSGLKTYVSDRTDLTKEQVIRLITSPDAKYVSLGDVWDKNLIKNTKDSTYDTAKPEILLKFIIEASTIENDIVLDFFIGGGTTASVCLKLNRRFIGIEQLQFGINSMIPRLKKVLEGKHRKGISKSVKWKGGGSFIYCELAKLNQNFIDKIQSSKTTSDLLLIWNTIQEKGFLSENVDIKSINENIDDFKQLSIKEQKQFLIEVLDKNQLYVNYSEINDKEYQISEKDKKINKSFYEE